MEITILVGSLCVFVLTLLALLFLYRSQQTFQKEFRSEQTRALSELRRELATLLEAGLPLVRALRTLERQAKGVNPNLNKVVANLADLVEGGATFSEAPASIVFDANGRAAVATVSVTNLSATLDIRVEAETGYVH